MLASWWNIIFDMCVFGEFMFFWSPPSRQAAFFIFGAPSSGGCLSTEWFPVRLPAKILLMIVSINHRIGTNATDQVIRLNSNSMLRIVE